MSNDTQTAPDTAPVRTPARAHVAGRIELRQKAEDKHRGLVDAGYRAGEAGRTAKSLQAKIELALGADGEALAKWVLAGSEGNPPDLIDDERFDLMKRHAQATALAAASLPAQERIGQQAQEAAKAALEEARRVAHSTVPVINETYEALTQEAARLLAELMPLHQQIIGYRDWLLAVAHGTEGDDRYPLLKRAEEVAKGFHALGVPNGLPAPGMQEAWAAFKVRLTQDADATFQGAAA